MRRAFLLTALALAAGAVCAGPCAASPDPAFPALLGEGEEAASVIEALRPEAATDINAALRLGWLLHVYENDNAAAKALFARVVEAEPDRIWARFGLASIAKVEGDYAAVAEHMAAVVERRPEHPLVELALHSLDALWADVPRVRGADAALVQALLEQPGPRAPEVTAVAADFLWRHLEWTGRFDERDALLDATGTIRSWRFTGPFEPLGDLLFFAHLAPDDDAALADSYTSLARSERTRRYDSPVADIEPPWVRSGVRYAETFVWTAAPTAALLYVSTGGPIDVDLNGRRVYLKDTFHEFVPRAQTIRVELPAGWSRLRLRYQAPDRVIVRLFDEQGAPLDVQVDPAPRQVELTNGAASSLVPTPCEAYLDALDEADPGNPLVLVLRAQLEHQRRNTEAAKHAVLDSLEAYDGWAGSRLVAGIILAGDRTQPERIARSLAKKQYQRAITLAGQCPVALYALARYEAQENRTKEALEKLETCVEQAPGNVLWPMALYGIYSDRGWAKEREMALDSMLELNADGPSVVRTALGFYQQTNRADEAHGAEMRLHAGTARSTILAESLAREGRLDEAIAEYARLIAAYPDQTYLKRGLIGLDEEAGRFDDAAGLLRELLDEDPDSTDLLRDLAEVELARGRLGEAIRLWQRVLEIEPADLTTRRALRLHGGKDSFAPYEIDIAPYLSDESLREQYAEYGSVLVVDYAIEQVFANGSGLQYTHQLVLVNKKAGIAEWGEIDVPHGELLELRVIKPDGTIIEPELVGNKSSISLTGLADGDYIEIKYIEPSYAARQAPPSFLGGRFFFCSGSSPMHLTRYLLMAPESLALEIESLNVPVEPTVWTTGGWRCWQWERHHVEPILSEPNSVGGEEYMPWVRAGFGQQAGVEPAIYENANIGMTTPTREVRAQVAELLTPEMTHDEIVHTLHTWIGENIDGQRFGPTISEPASHTLGDRQGNRIGLLKAMLDVAGIGSHVVVVRPTTSFDSTVFPNNHPYALLLVDDAQGRPATWLDLNNKFYAYGYIHPQIQGGRGIMLRNVEAPDATLRVDLDTPRRTIRVPVLPETQVTQQLDADMHVDEAGTLEATITVTLTGLTAAAGRTALEQADEDRLKNLIQVTLANYFDGASLTEYSIDDRKSIDTPLVARATFTAPRYARKRGRTLTFRQPLFSLRMRSSYTRVKDRKTPLALFGLPSSRITVNIVLPEGTTIANPIEPLAVQNDFASYALSFNYDEATHTATMKREFIMPIQRVQPAAYPAFAEFCRQIDEHEENELKVTLPEAPEQPAVEEGPAVEGQGGGDEGLEDEGVEDDASEKEPDGGTGDEGSADEPSDAPVPLGVPG